MGSETDTVVIKAPSNQLPEPEEININIPGYQIHEAIGQGGMAIVFKATQINLDRTVAIKVINAEMSRDRSFCERFSREARTVAKLQHANIINIYDVGETSDGRQFLSMEFIEGVELKTLIKKVTLSNAIKYVQAIGDALDYAGSRGLIHRDVKPENIMITKDGNRPVLMDFGIVKGKDQTLSTTKTGTVLGTPYYMSPEQAKGGEVDHRADIYSLGVIFYQLLTGELPYDAESAVSLGIKHIQEPIPTLPDYLFDNFQPVLNLLLAKQPDERYQTGADLIKDLDAIDQATREKIAAVFDQNDRQDLNKTRVYQYNNTSSKINTVSQRKSSNNRRGYGLMVASVLIIVIAGGYAFYPDVSQLLVRDEAQESISENSAAMSIVPPTKSNLNQAPTTVKTEPEPDATQIKIEVLLKESQTLARNLTDDLSTAKPLMDLYRKIELLDEEKKHRDAVENGISNIQTMFERRISEVLDERNSDQAEQYLNNLLVAMPEQHASQFVKEIDIAIKNQRVITRLMSEAQSYLKEYLLTPISKGDKKNAHSIFERVLEMESGHQGALEGFRKIKERYVELARQNLERGDLKQAIRYVDKGVAVRGDGNYLFDEVKHNIDDEKQRRKSQQEANDAKNKQISALLTEAKALEEQQIFTSDLDGKSALQVYNDILTLEPLHTEASDALENIIENYMQSVIDQMEKNDFIKADEMLTSLLNQVPGLLDKARYKTIHDAIVENKVKQQAALEIEASAPKIEHIRVSGQSFDSVEQTDPVLFSNKLFIWFDYARFSEGSVITVSLNNSAKEQLTLSSEVIIEPDSTYSMVINPGRQGLPEGQYILHFSYEQQLVTSHTFTIK